MSMFALVSQGAFWHTFDCKRPLSLYIMQKHGRGVLILCCEDQLSHDDYCKNSFVIQGMSQTKGLLVLFKASAISTDNQKRLALRKLSSGSVWRLLETGSNAAPTVLSSARAGACYHYPCQSGGGGCWRCWALRAWPSECEQCQSAWRAPPPGPASLSLDTQTQCLSILMRTTGKVHSHIIQA